MIQSVLILEISRFDSSCMGHLLTCVDGMISAFRQMDHNFWNAQIINSVAELVDSSYSYILLIIGLLYKNKSLKSSSYPAFPTRSNFVLMLLCINVMNNFKMTSEHFPFADYHQFGRLFSEELHLSLLVFLNEHHLKRRSLIPFSCSNHPPLLQKYQDLCNSTIWEMENLGSHKMASQRGIH